MTVLSCCILVRDDASTLEACLQSIRPHVDQLVICDTGSSDDSPAIAQKYADRWELFLGCNGSDGLIEDFAMARNHSFSLATGDWRVWFDADDLVHGGDQLRKLCEEATADYIQYLFPYEYARDAAGNVVCLQMRERLMRPPHAMRWRSPVHEYCAVEAEGAVPVMVATDRVVVEHRSHLSKKQREPGRNLRILEKHVARSGESDVRALYYLGVEYAARGAVGDLGQSLRYLKRYVQLADWDDEKCKALLNIGQHYANFGDHEEAQRWILAAMTTKRWPEPYFALGRSYYAMAQRGERPEYNYRRANSFIMDGLSRETDIVLFANPQDRYTIHATLNVCFHAVGDNERALWSCEEGLKGCDPELREAIEANPAAYEGQPYAMLLTNRREYLKDKTRRTVFGGLDELVKLGAVPELQAEMAKAALRGDMRIESEAARPEPTALPPSKLEPQSAEPGKLDVVLFLGPAYERWTPETLAKTGMGGSETMAAEMAKRLRKLGHRVRVFADCEPRQEGLYDGVEWLQWQRFRDVRCDVLIASRTPWAVEDEVTVNFGGAVATIGGCKATVTLLWVHDIHCGPDLNLRRLARIDRILCLSEWHKRTFRNVYMGGGGTSVIPEDKVIVTRNGVALERFDGTEERNPHRAVYSSSPDRGLLAAVMVWPKVREKVPDAELHCYYGWLNWERAAEQAGDDAQLGQIAHLKQLCKATPGIVMRDRVNQKELAREFMRAGVWAYGTGFTETSCCTAMEAQAAGLLMVTSPVAALVETAGANASMLKTPLEYGTVPTAEFLEEYANEIVEAMTMPDPDAAEFRKRAQSYARAHFGLDELAEQWSEMLEKLHAELTEQVVPAFREMAVAE